jgi:predicted protein tyrosine phosphatase
MGTIVVAPLGKIAELAVRHRCRDMLSLVAPKQTFHRPAVIAAERHLIVNVNDIAFAGTGKLVAPGEGMWPRSSTLPAAGTDRRRCSSIA